MREVRNTVSTCPKQNNHQCRTFHWGTTASGALQTEVPTLATRSSQMVAMSASYQRAYRARISQMQSTRVYAIRVYRAPIILQPKKEKTRKIGTTHGVYRMRSFSGDPKLRLYPR